MNDEWWMSDEWWMNEWWIIIDDWWLMIDEIYLIVYDKMRNTWWWLMNDDWWMMIDEWWLMKSNLIYEKMKIIRWDYFHCLRLDDCSGYGLLLFFIVPLSLLFMIWCNVEHWMLNVEWRMKNDGKRDIFMVDDNAFENNVLTCQLMIRFMRILTCAW